MNKAEKGRKKVRAGRGRKVAEALLAAMAVLIAAGAGSICLVCRLVPSASETIGFLTENDGYYQIYTADDYNRFWKWAEEDPFIKGRLMNDIYLNNISDYDQWENCPPKKKIEKVDSFSGDFDGNGRTIYGLYSIYGYGLVKENAGKIYDLSIRKSYIRGDSSVGGICQDNFSFISDCVFGGKLASTNKDITNYDKMAGICTTNYGEIEKCGFEGSMEITSGWRLKGFRAGICTFNHYSGNIRQCYNLSFLKPQDGGDLCYAIANRWEENCVARKDSAWMISCESQVTLIEGEEILYFSALMEKDLYKLYYLKQHLPEYYQQVFRFKEELKGKYEAETGGNIWPGWEREEENGQSGKDRIVMAVLSDPAAERFVKSLMDAKEMDWYKLTVEAAMEPTDDKDNLWEGALWTEDRQPAAVWIGDGEDRVKIARYPYKSWDFEKDAGETDYEALWKICETILGDEDFTHYTWQVHYDREAGQEDGCAVLYQTNKGESGFFFVTDDEMVQVQGFCSVQKDKNDAASPNDITDMKNIISETAKWRDQKGSSRAYKKEQKNKEIIEEVLQNKLLEGTFYELWDEGLPEDEMIWQDEAVQKSVYSACACYDGKVPAVEEILGIQQLLIRNSEGVGTFKDLSKLPHLSELTVEQSGGGDISLDITGDMVPELQSLFVEGVLVESGDFLRQLPKLSTLGMIHCGLTDISFLEELPQLTELSLFGNELTDISPIVNCRELEILSLANNNLTDITPLTYLPRLKEVGLQGNRITDIEALGEIGGLEKLNLTSNQLRDITPLGKLDALKALGLADNEIQDITALEGMTHLFNLALDANQIRDIGPLKNMTELEYLGLSGNQIEDYTPVKEMDKLYSLNVAGNPGQDIGKLVFRPWVTFGGGEQTGDVAQAYLDQYYPGENIKAGGLVKGDIDGDGRLDMAIIGLVDWSEDSQWSGERYIYPFISRPEGAFIPLTPLETLGPGMGGVYGDPYQGTIITDGMLVIQVYGGSNWRWGSTDIYEYEDGEMQEKWRIGIGHFVYNSGMDITVQDLENDSWKVYLAIGDWEEHKEVLLFSEETGEPNPLKEEMEQKIAQFGSRIGRDLPKDVSSEAKPAHDGWYEYYIVDYPVKRQPSQVLETAAEKFLENAVPLPVPCYTSEEIRETCEKLIGAPLPENFYIGLLEGSPVLLYYRDCWEEDGGFVHELDVEKPGEEGGHWQFSHRIYYYEDKDVFEQRMED